MSDLERHAPQHPSQDPAQQKRMSADLERYLRIYGHEFYEILEALPMVQQCLDAGNMGVAATWANKVVCKLREPALQEDTKFLRNRPAAEGMMLIVAEIVEIFKTTWSMGFSGVIMADRDSILEVMRRLQIPEGRASQLLNQHYREMEEERHLSGLREIVEKDGPFGELEK